MKLDELKYDITIEQVTEVTRKVHTDCNSLQFINIGIPIVFIDNFPLQQYQILPIPGNMAERCVTEFTVKGNTAAGLYVIKKNYVQ